MELSRKLSTAILPMTYLAKWKNTALRQTAVEPLASDEAERSLRIGDYVSLFSVEHNGYLSTDGCVLTSQHSVAGPRPGPFCISPAS
jgi:hypothetical protein